MGGLCPSGEVDEEVEKVKNKEYKKNSDIVHFFMLGIEGAGKTTIIRQLKCLCMQKPHNYEMYDDDWRLIDREQIFDEHELEGLRNVVRINVLTAAAALIRKTRDLHEDALAGSVIADKILRKCTQLYESGDDLYHISNQVESEYGADIIEILADQLVARSLELPYKITGIEDGTRYFIKDEGRLKNIFNDSYQLTNDDIVHVRKPTVTIKSYKFRIKKLRVEIHDMGGQKTELVKIPQLMRQFLATSGYCFLLYVSSLAAFQEPDKDSKGGHTVLEKSAAIFDNILRLDGVKECAIMVFFNKQDRFEEICRDMLSDDENGDGKRQIEKLLGVAPKAKKDANKKTKNNKPENYDYLKNAIQSRFKEILKEHNVKKSYYMKYTQATDAQLMSTIFYAVENEINTDFLTQARYI